MRDITAEVLESPVITGDITSGKSATSRKGNKMPAKVTVSSFVSRSGKRGRKATVNYSEWAMESGDVLDISDDFENLFTEKYDGTISLADYDFEGIMSENDEAFAKARKAVFDTFKRYAAKGSGDVSQSEFAIGIAEDESGDAILAIARK